MGADDGPLLVFGPRSLDYDFGTGHPLTPLRFGPGIDLLAEVGAIPGLAPEPAPDEALRLVHRPEYLAAVRRFSEDPSRPEEMGIGLSDNPPFPGMHEAAAAVAGGSLAAIEAILRGETLHAHHPGGGLHHAMAARAWGFCIYNDAALAVARARAAGLRVLYVDLDVHHGDGVQAAAWDDPGVLTLSIHETGRHLFPGTGAPHEVGEGRAAGTSVNMPLEPFSGPGAWLAAVRALLPALAAVFRPDLVVSQHGSDTHAADPLAHLRLTTRAMWDAAVLVDAVAHRWAAGRWLATGGGGYDAYRVVPRAWALTWLAGAHREPPPATPGRWRDRWAGPAAAFGTPGMPASFLDPEREPAPGEAAADARSLETLAAVRALVLPRLVREAEDRGWWRPAPGASGEAGAPSPGALLSPGAPPTGTLFPAAPPPADGGRPVIVFLEVAALDRLALAPRVLPLDPEDAHALLHGAMAAGARLAAAVEGEAIVGVALSAPAPGRASTESLLAVGVTPGRRGSGLGTALLRELVRGRPAGTGMEAGFGVAERDVVEPLPVEERRELARRLLASAGFRLAREGGGVGGWPREAPDPWRTEAFLDPR